MKLPVDDTLAGPVKRYSFHKKPMSSGFMFAVFANLLWGTSFLASKYTLLSWGPFTSSSLRFGIATIALFIVLRLMDKKIEVPKDKDQWIGLIIIATTGFGMLYPLQLAGMRLIPSSLSAAIMLISPLLVLVFGRAILNEKLSALKWIALCLGLAGGSLLISSTHGTVNLKLDGDFVFGSVLTLLSAASLAGSVIATRRYSKYFTSSSLTFWSMAIGFFCDSPS